MCIEFDVYPPLSTFLSPVYVFCGVVNSAICESLQNIIRQPPYSFNQPKNSRGIVTFVFQPFKYETNTKIEIKNREIRKVKTQKKGLKSHIPPEMKKVRHSVLTVPKITNPIHT